MFRAYPAARDGLMFGVLAVVAVSAIEIAGLIAEAVVRVGALVMG